MQHGPQAHEGLSWWNRVQLLAHQTLTVAFDLVFPPHCVYCGRVGSFLCSRCLSDITPYPQRTYPALDGALVRGEFAGAIRAAIHALKYEKQTRLAAPLGRLLVEMIADVQWPVDVVVPVPLHVTRLRERGYNQAMLLSHHIAYAKEWKLSPTAITRIRHTPSQVDLNAHERQANVAGAFWADAEIVGGQRVLLVDDVITTGATLAACAQALRSAGATHVYGMAVAGATGAP
jgi:ComF family protein